MWYNLSMQRNRFYHSKNLPKFSFGSYHVCQRLGLLDIDLKTNVHDRILEKVKLSTKEALVNFFNTNNLTLGNEIILNGDITMPETLQQSLSNNFQIQARLTIVNTLSFLKNLNINSFEDRKEPFELVVDSFGDINLFESNPVEYSTTKILHDIEDYLNHSRNDKVINLRDYILSRKPHLEYASFLCDIVHSKYLKIKNEVSDFYVMKDAYYGACYLIDKSSDARQELKSFNEKVSKLKLARNLNEELNKPLGKKKNHKL